MNTLLLAVDTWDLVLDASGNIAMASDPYSIAQDVASALRLFLGELWYDTTKGIPYLQQILGETPPLIMFQQYLEDAALTVPQVATAVCVVESFNTQTRTVVGQVQFTTTNGQTGTVSL